MSPSRTSRSSVVVAGRRRCSSAVHLCAALAHARLRLDVGGLHGRRLPAGLLAVVATAAGLVSPLRDRPSGRGGSGRRVPLAASCPAPFFALAPLLDAAPASPSVARRLGRCATRVGLRGSRRCRSRTSCAGDRLAAGASSSAPASLLRPASASGPGAGRGPAAHRRPASSSPLPRGRSSGRPRTAGPGSRGCWPASRCSRPSGRTAPDHHAEREDVQRQLVHDRGLRVAACAGVCRATECRAVRCVKSSPRSSAGSSRSACCGDRGARAASSCSSALRHAGRQLGPEEVGLDERARPRARRRSSSRSCPAEHRSTWNRPMNTGICTSIGRQPPSGLTPCSRLQLLHLLRQLLLVVRVLLLELLDLRRELLHLAHRADLLHERLEQDRAQREDQEHDRQRPGDAAGLGRTRSRTPCANTRG